MSLGSRAVNTCTDHPAPTPPRPGAETASTETETSTRSCGAAAVNLQHSRPAASSTSVAAEAVVAGPWARASTPSAPTAVTDADVTCTEDDVDALFRSTYARLCQVIARMLHNDRALAEEVVQDAFVVVYQRRGTVRRDTATNYLWRVAINEAKTLAGRLQRETHLVDKATRTGFLPGQESGLCAEGDTEFAHVRAFVNALPVDQRIIVLLHYYCDWPDERIAEVVGCSPVTARSRLHRARKTLKTQMVRRGLGPRG